MRLNIEFEIKTLFTDTIEVPDEIGLRALQIIDRDFCSYQNDADLLDLLRDYIDFDNIFSPHTADVEDFKVTESKR